MPVKRKALATLDKSGVRRLVSQSHGGDFVAAMHLALKGGPRLTIRQAADLAGVSVRTLQRRLASEGLAYSDLVDQVRAELASELLEDPDVSLAEAATALGYSTPSNFSRAFQRWNGLTPAAYIRARRIERIQ